MARTQRPHSPRVRPTLVGAFIIGVTTAFSTAANDGDTIDPRSAQIMPEAVDDILIDMDRTSSRFIAVGARGHIVRSTDGQQWDQVAAPVRSMLTRVEFLDDSVGWAVGHDAAILQTTDGGETWALRQFEPTWYQALYDVYFADATRGYAVGAYDLFLRTTDGGETWERMDTPIGEGGLHYYSITALNDGTLLIAGERGMLARSTDGGETWQRTVSPYFGSFFGSVAVGDTGAVVFGLRGNAYHLPDVRALETTDPDDYGEYPLGEVSDDLAVALDTGTVDSLFNGVSLDDGSALMVGVNGTILRYDPATSTTTRVNNPRNAALGDIAVHDGAYVLVGEAGVDRLAAQ